MTIKQANMKVTPVTMLLREINLANNISLVEDDIQLRDPVVVDLPTADVIKLEDGSNYTVTRNTSIDIDVLSDAVQDDFVTVTYERISLVKLFSLIKPALDAKDVNAAGADAVTLTEVTPELVWKAIVEKYEMLANGNDFTLTLAEDFTSLLLVANVNNYAYIGEVTIALDASLKMRVADTLLDGYHVVVPKPEVIA